MSTLSNVNLGLLAPPSVPPTLRSAGTPAGNDKLHEAFTQFVGETFYGQMIKAMRSTVGKPAYFHGGRAEEVFRGQLDQSMAEHLTKTSAARFSDPMFERQFPHLGDAAVSGSTQGLAGLNELGQLTRR